MIVAETEHFWVVDKPIGIAINDEVHAQGLMAVLSSELDTREDNIHPVHRLDKETSGLLLVAKHKAANRELSQAFQQRQVTKQYLAITSTKPGKKPKKKQGWVKGDMEKSRNGSWKLCSSRRQPAETFFRSLALGEGLRLCYVTPLTGKTHQIRVAMRSLSMPIVGDERYGGRAADRMYLHAYQLAFNAFGSHYQYTLWPTDGALFSTINESAVVSLVTGSVQCSGV